VPSEPIDTRQPLFADPSNGKDPVDATVGLGRAWERAGLTTPPTGGSLLVNMPAVIRWLADARDRLPGLITEIIRDSSTLAMVASRSYRHPNGFVKIPIQWEVGSGEALRLHVWADAIPDSDVHNHRWDFVSLPILGSFIERRYELVEGSEGQLLECRPRASDGTIAIRPINRGKAVLSDENKRVVGKSYECNSQVLHAIDPTAARLGATLIMRGPTVRRSALVHKAPEAKEIGAPLQMSSPNLMPADLVSILKTVTRSL
jgi:hypothetical protein